MAAAPVSRALMTRSGSSHRLLSCLLGCLRLLALLRFRVAGPVPIDVQFQRLLVVWGGAFTGVLLVATIDGAAAARNVIMMLTRMPKNSEIVFLRLGREDPDAWNHTIGIMEEVLRRSLDFFPEPLLKTERIKEAHNDGELVWSLPRTGRSTMTLLSVIETFAKLAWERARPHHFWPAPLGPSSRTSYVSGWDDDE